MNTSTPTLRLHLKVCVVGAILLGVFLLQYSNLEAAANPVSFWKFDENTGTTTLDSVGFSYGLLINNLKFGVGKFGSGLNFDGVDDRVKIVNDGLSNMKTVTLSSWIYPRSAGGNGLGRIISKSNNTTVRGGSSRYAFLMNKDNSIEFRAGYSTTIGSWKTPPGSLPLNSWHQVTVTYTHDNVNNTPTIYIDGIAQSLTSLSIPSGAQVADDSNLYIGSRGVDNAVVFDGIIDQVRIYNQALSSSEVNQIYISDNPPEPLTDLGWDAIITPISFPSVPQFYSPEVIYDSGIYKMWATAGDRIRYYTSSDGKNWTGGQTVLSAEVGSWEDDGNNFEGYQGGISNPVVVKGVTPGYLYTMYYTAGEAHNTSTQGGLGIAFSNDGENWTRYKENPFRSTPGGRTNLAQALTIGKKRYLYYTRAYDFVSGLDVVIAEDSGDGIHFINEKVFPLRGVVPIFYDNSTGTCWMTRALGGSPSGPKEIHVYSNSDCFTNVGTEIAVINSQQTGNITNFGHATKERDSNGQRVSATSSVQLYFASGNTWGNWQPKSVTLTPVKQPISLSAGDRVAVSKDSINIRVAPAGTILGKQFINAKGTVVDGPITKNGYIWWKIDYDSSFDGWSAGDYLTKIGNKASVSVVPMSASNKSPSITATAIFSEFSKSLVNQIQQVNYLLGIPFSYIEKLIYK